MSIQKYPIGHQDFAKIINEGFVYVDKTRFVHQLAERGGYYFLSRPRRFGKSLLISTFDYLFKGKKELFKGLYIEDKWVFEEYPIIKISFASLAYENNNLDNALKKTLLEISSSYGLQLDAEDPLKDLFDRLIKSLYEKFNKKVVVLIDEYDKPLIDYLQKENLHQALDNRSILKSFYSILKDADPYLKLVFITGVSKFSQVSIFSDLNNLYDLTMQADFNEICGISQVELEQYFPDELKKYDKEEIKKWYNGYRWHFSGDTLYNPFSILNFLVGGDFRNFWYTTATPTFLMKKSRDEQFYRFDDIEIGLNDLQSFDIENIVTIPLLFQTGYLTIVGYDPIMKNVRLGFPNNEVKESYLTGLADMYIQPKALLSKSILDSLLKALRAHNAEGLERAINSAFAQIPYDLWQKENEHFYHAIVHLLFSLLGVYIHSEVHTQYGRADALIIFEENIYCLEFKLNKSAQEAINQIQKTGYLDKYKDSTKTIHAIGINFNSESKKVDGLIWQ